MIRNLRHVLKSLNDLKLNRINQLNKSFLTRNNRGCLNFIRTKKDDSSLFKPLPIKPTEDDINVGAEITGSTIDKSELLRVINKFSQKREIRMLCMENGLDRKYLRLTDGLLMVSFLTSISVYFSSNPITSFW